MNKQEVLELIRTIEIAYNFPWTRKREGYAKYLTDEELIIEVVNVWYEYLKDQKTEWVMKRLKYHIETKPFPPTVSDLRRQVIGRDIPDTYVHDLSAGEDWN